MIKGNKDGWGRIWGRRDKQEGSNAKTAEGARYVKPLKIRPEGSLCAVGGVRNDHCIRGARAGYSETPGAQSDDPRGRSKDRRLIKRSVFRIEFLDVVRKQDSKSADEVGGDGG